MRFVVAREPRRQIDKLELALMEALRAAEVVALAIPGLGGPNFDIAMEYAQWCVAQLTARDLAIQVATCRRPRMSCSRSKTSPITASRAFAACCFRSDSSDGST